MTGRYECVNETSSKFWELQKTTDGFEAHWGRIGGTPSGPKLYTEGEAMKVVAGKLKKGYVKVD